LSESTLNRGEYLIPVSFTNPEKADYCYK